MIVFLGALFFFVIGIYFIVIPSFTHGRRMLKANKTDERYPVQVGEVFFLVGMISLGYIVFWILKEDFEMLDWRYIHYVWIISGLSTIFYFISRKYKEVAGPLLLVIIPSFLFLGILLSLAEIIHFSLMALVGGLIFPFTFLTLPIFALVYGVVLFSVELYCVITINKARFMEREHKGPLGKFILKFYFGKYRLLGQILTFPVFITLVQFILMLLDQEPDGIIKAFTESHDGVFSKGACEDCVNYSASEYICTIAAFGSPALVRPIHIGHRHGNLIKVTRQLKVCNAFEEWLTERTPRTQKVLRKIYDDLQIPIEKWSKVKWVANTLYILIKPMEWAFLLFLYLVEKHPEKRIARQYLPVKNTLLNP